MNISLSHQEYHHLEGLVRSAWVKLNQAGDTPDSHKSIQRLHSALGELRAVAAALHGNASLEEILARHHHSVLKNRSHPSGILQALEDRAQEIHRHPQAPAENVPDALLVHSAIPVIWRMVRSLRHEVRRLRPGPDYARLRSRAKRLARGLLVAGLLAAIIWPLLPWGCIVTYYRPGGAFPFRGGGFATTLFHDYGEAAPLPWMSRDGWSARWTGSLLVPQSAEYSFFAQCAGGMRLWLDGEILIDNWHSAGWVHGGQHAQRELQAGPHSFRMEFHDRSGPSAVRVRWAGGPIPPNTLVGFPHLRKF